MHQDATNAAPSKGIWRRFLILIPLVVVLVIASRTYIHSVCSTYTAQTDPIEDAGPYDSYGLDDIRYSIPGVVEATSVEHLDEGMVAVTFRALADGETTVVLGDVRPSKVWDIRVSHGAIIEGGVNFSGWRSIHLSFCIVLGVLVVLFTSALAKLMRHTWFGYEMVACGGGLLFCLFQFLLFTYLLLERRLICFDDMAYAISFMADYFLVLTSVPMGVLALLVSASNVPLVLHEGRRPANLLGIATSVVWFVVIFFWMRLQLYLDGETRLDQVMEVVSCLIAVAIVYGECLLLSTIVCAWAASRHVPKHPVDYLMVLGCGMRPDGTPTPLLAGRVDRAYEFDVACIAAGGKPTTFVPSGGRGPDELMSEAQSMRDYLVKKGVEPERIVLEDRSTSTRENMVYSREVIERHAGRDANEAVVAFSTTNYHVFRGYVYAHQAGMVAEGMGSSTKTYFWPNAFLREFAGLLVAQWGGILQTYLAIAVVYALAEYILILA